LAVGSIRKFNKKKWNPSNLLNNKKGTGVGIEFAIQNAIQENNDTDKTGKEDIKPKEAYLEQLYLMGFPLILAKQALISVKNSSVDAAIEKMLILQEEEKKNCENVPAIENLTMIKPLWICSLCTLENESMPNAEPMCEACGSPPGISAYYTA